MHGRGEPVFCDDPRWDGLLPHFSEDVRRRTDLRAVIVVTAERISDSCGFAVPEESFSDYCAGKPYVGVSLDGLPGLPLPLPPRTS